MKDLQTLTKQELKDFFNSFDYFLCDIDGVLWHFLGSIPGANDGINCLTRLNKHIILVSNNTTRTSASIQKKLDESGFDLKEANCVSPIPVMVSYLQKKNLSNKTVFVLSMDPLKEALKEAGFKLAENGPDRVKEVHEHVERAIDDDGSVGAVIADIDINMNNLNMQKAVTFLRRKEVVFLGGATDLTFAADQNRFLIGPGAFKKVVEETSGRKAIPLAKPHPNFNEYIVEKYNITDPSRVLFVGDSIPEDMGFAANCGYKKLLVFSGLAKRSWLEKWAFSEELKPDFYAESLKTVHDAFVQVFGRAI